MKDFQENHCRCCKKVFCCKKCRTKHENNEHGIFPECDICLYGRAILTNASENLLEHVKSRHWPLRCVFCKRFFGTTDELKKHSKCPVGLKIEDLEKSPYSPVQPHNESMYDSPPLSLLLPKNQQQNKNLNMFSTLATSTPMQRGDENLLEQMQEAITPLDYSESDNKESINKAKSNSDTASKRKVTFCETPMAESYRKQKSVLKKKQNQEERLSVGSGSGNSGIFYSVKEEPQEDENENQIITVENQQPPLPVVVVETWNDKTTEDKENVKHEDTLWISAINASPSDIVRGKPNFTPDSTSPKVQAAVTPLATQLKKRQVNIVMPTHITKNSDLSPPGSVTETKPEKKRLEISVDEDNPGNSLVKSSFTEYSSKTDTENLQCSNPREALSETSLCAVQNRLWTSMSRLIKNVTSALQNVAGVEGNTPRNLKRRSSEYDSPDGPSIKRYKLTRIKCRPPIRELTMPNWEVHESFRRSYEQYRRKHYVDKATQTDDYLMLPLIDKNKDL